MAIGALLHDAAEDQGGSARLADIRNRFGDRVANFVGACSATSISSLARAARRLLELVGLMQNLSDAMGVEVDLVTKDGLKCRIGQRILSEVVTL